MRLPDLTTLALAILVLAGAARAEDECLKALETLKARIAPDSGATCARVTPLWRVTARWADSALIDPVTRTSGWLPPTSPRSTVAVTCWISHRPSPG